MNSLFIFSLDGVLIDSRKDIFAACNMLRADYELGDLSPHDLKAAPNMSSCDLVRTVIGDSSVDLDEAVRRYQKHYETCMFDSSKLYIGARDGIKKLHSVSHRLAILSNKPTHVTHMILDHFGLTQYMFMIIGEGGDHPIKPDPAAITMMIHEAEAAPNCVWFVSDNEADLTMATQAGVKRGFAKYGYGTASNDSFDLKMMSFIDFEKFIDRSDRF